MLTSKIVLHKLYLQQLRDMGAEVIDIDGIMVCATFQFPDDFNVSYLYHRNPDNTYLLERIKPFHLHIGDYPTEEAAVENISSDIDQIKNARNSHKFGSFVDTLKLLNKVQRDFDDLFLYYNINGEDMQYVYDNVKLLSESVYKIKKRSKRIYHKTEPQSLQD